MSKILVIGDVHLSDTVPRSRTEGYKQQVFDKLDQAHDIALEQDVDAIVQTGDLFDKPQIRTSFLGDVIGFFDQLEVPIYAIFGNHELKYGSVRYQEQSPLDILFRSGVVKNLVEEPLEFDDFIVIGKHFEKNPQPPEILEDKTTVFVCHQYKVPQWGDESEVLASTEADLTIYGHDHTRKVGDGFLQPGALTRKTSEFEDMHRDVKVDIVSGDLDITTFDLDIVPPEEAFDRAVLDEKERKSEMEDYVQLLKDRSSSMDSSDQVMEKVREYCEDEGVVRLIQENLKQEGLL